MKIKGKISISRWSNDKINITLQDEASDIQFVDIEMTLEDFAKVITGCGHTDCEGEVRGLEYVGMKRVREDRTVICPLSTYGREDKAEWLEKNCQEEGWLLSTYLGSQGSITHKDGHTILNYYVTKYVPVNQEAEANVD